MTYIVLKDKCAKIKSTHIETTQMGQNIKNGYTKECLAYTTGAKRLVMPADKRLADKPIRIADYPQLKLIAWNRRADATLDEKEALALYERNWRHVEESALEAKERILIDRLVKTIGKGVLLV